MKTKGCMFIALIISGTAFGQQAAVKQSAKIESKTQVNSSPAGTSGKAEIKTDSRVEGSGAASASGNTEIKSDGRVGGNAVNGEGAAATGAKTELKSDSRAEGSAAGEKRSASASGSTEIKTDSRVEGSVAHSGEGAVSVVDAINNAQELLPSGKENGVSSAELTHTAEGILMVDNSTGNSGGGLLTELNSAGNTALEHASSHSAAAAGTTISTATEVKTTSTQNLEKVNERLMKTAAASKEIGAGVNATVNNALKIKAAPLKINTRIVSAAGLGVF